MRFTQTSLAGEGCYAQSALWHRHHKTAILLLLVLTTIVLHGCGGSGGDAGPSSACFDEQGQPLCVQDKLVGFDPVMTDVPIVPFPIGGVPQSAHIEFDGLEVVDQAGCYMACAAFAT